jgi:hypothetical protein
LQHYSLTPPANADPPLNAGETSGRKSTVCGINGVLSAKGGPLANYILDPSTSHRHLSNRSAAISTLGQCGHKHRIFVAARPYPSITGRYLYLRESGNRVSPWLVGAQKGTREIRVILYAKDDPFCATALADELPIEDILAVEHDIVPFDWADVFQQGEIDSMASGSHSLAGTCRAARNLPRSGLRRA